MDETIRLIQSALSSSNISESLIVSVLRRLVSFRYNLNGGADGCILAFAMQKVENHIKNSCNVSSIPDGLFNIAVDRVCGEFLFTKKQTGQLEIAELDLDGSIASISEGDTSVTFDKGSTDEEKFNQLLNALITSGEGELVCYRKLKW